MKNTTPVSAPVQARDERLAQPVSDSDRLFRGLPLESGEAQPSSGKRLH